MINRLQKGIYGVTLAGLLLFSNGAQAVGSLYSEAFDRILISIQEAVEQKTLRRGSNYNPLASFYQGIGDAANDFALLEDEFQENAFENIPSMKEAFKKLCKTIATIDRSVKTSADIKPRHIRWIKDDLADLSKRAIATQKKVDNREDFNLIPVIRRLNNNQAFSYSSTYVGSGLDKLGDVLIHRPWEFFKRNWWWNIPVLAGAAKVYWDAKNYPDNNKQDPENWNLETTGQPESNWYKKLLSLAALSFFGSRFHDGFIKMNNTMHLAGEPIGREAPAYRDENVSYNQFRGEIILAGGEYREINRDYNRRIITQLPCLRQEGLDCGYHALYNALCFATQDYAALVNRELFDETLMGWKDILQANEARWADIERHGGQIEQQDMGIIARLSGDCDAIRRQDWDEDQNPAPEVSPFDDDISVIADINGVEGIFQTEILGGVINNEYMHRLLRNIHRFRNGHNRQVIMVNLGNLNARGHSNGVHWIAMVLEYNPATQTDHILIGESTGSDYRTRRIIKRVYQLFRTDPLPQAPHPNFYN